MIKPIRNTFLVSIDIEAESKITLSNGLELFIDKEFGEQSNTTEQNSELSSYFKELEIEYSMVYDEWVTACKKKYPTVIHLKRRLLQIEGEQKKHNVNKVIKPYANSVQHGTVEAVPSFVDARVKKYDKGGRLYYDGYFQDVDIKVGDKVYFHHFVSLEENQIVCDLKTLYKAEYNQIICVVRDGEIIPVEKWVLAMPIMETDEDIMYKVGDIILYKKVAAEKKYLLSTLKYVSPEAKKCGFSVGETIVHPQFSEYSIKIEGVSMYRMHIDDVFCAVTGV